MLFLSRQPLGPLLLGCLCAGLAAYAALNIAGAINDPERRGVTPHGVIARSVDVLTGALYIVLAVAALAIVVDPPESETSIVVRWAAVILELPFGPFLLGLGGAALIVSGGYLFHRAREEPFGHMLDKRSLSAHARRMIAHAARAGTAARGVIFAVCGIFAIRAALSASPDDVADVGKAMDVIAGATFGPLLIAMIGAGFIAYGGYQLAKARYQRISH
jgi:hypothetical protein